MLLAGLVPLNMFLVWVNRRHVDVSNLWLLPRAPCWRWRRVSLETETEFRGSERRGWDTGMASLSPPFSFCFLWLSVLHCASGAIRLPLQHMCVSIRPQTAGSACWRTSAPGSVRANQQPISWLFLKLLTVFPVFMHTQGWDVGACNCDLCASSVR